MVLYDKKHFNYIAYVSMRHEEKNKTVAKSTKSWANQQNRAGKVFYFWNAPRGGQNKTVSQPKHSAPVPGGIKTSEASRQKILLKKKKKKIKNVSQKQETSTKWQVKKHGGEEKQCAETKATERQHCDWWRDGNTGRELQTGNRASSQTDSHTQWDERYRNMKTDPKARYCDRARHTHTHAGREPHTWRMNDPDSLLLCHITSLTTKRKLELVLLDGELFL